MGKFIKEKIGSYAFALGFAFNFALAGPLFGAAGSVGSLAYVEKSSEALSIRTVIPVLAEQVLALETEILPVEVPFYSQFRDIYSAKWQKVGCGIASMAMVIEFYRPGSVSVAGLLNEAIVSGAYRDGVGWKHKELAALAGKYGLKGESRDLTEWKNSDAFSRFLDFLKDGPVIVSIHNKFDPQAALGHIVVVTGFEDGFIFYNDPAESKPAKKISRAGFLDGWKKRFIFING